MTFNREQRREIARRQKAAGHAVVTLRGGPMNGWLVKADSPSLRKDWYTTWPPGVARQWNPGRYIVDSGEAHWREGKP